VATTIPTIEIRPAEPDGALDAALRDRDPAGWIAVTSTNGATAVLDAARRLGVHLSAARWAAVGDATRDALEAWGIPVAFTPTIADGERLAAELPLAPGTAVLLPRADLADRRLVDGLEARGARVTAVTAYHTVLGPAGSRERLRAYFANGGPDAIVFTSGSTVLGLLEILGTAHRAAARAALACCIGARTASVARAKGFDRVAISDGPGLDDLVSLLAAALPEPLEVS
jgi:uroporphyrinogen-III synthase